MPLPKSTKSPTRVGIYARVSTRDQTVVQQLGELEEFCRRSGWEMVDRYVDEGVSALKANRPEFSRLLEDVRKRRVNTVLVYKLDRFSRSLREFLNTIELLERCGAHFVSYSDRFLDTTTNGGRLMFQVIGAIAEFERGLISERTKLKLAYLRQNGKTLGRPVKVDPQKALSLRQKGLSLAQIGRELGADRSTVSKVLKKGRSEGVLGKGQTIGVE